MDRLAAALVAAGATAMVAAQAGWGGVPVGRAAQLMLGCAIAAFALHLRQPGRS